MSVATEQVLVVRRDDMFPDGAWHGFVTENLERHQRVIRERHTFKPRAEVENDPTFQQIIPYVVFRHGDRYFLTHRLRASSEKRLRKQYSLGVGGHINPGDLEGAGDPILDGLKREWEEEVVYDGRFEARLLGFLNEDSSPVSKVHLGVVFVVDGDSPNIRIRETDKLAGELLTLDEIPIGIPFMTGWRARRSLRRLGVDHMDLYQQHWPSALFPPGATMPRFKRLMDEGLTRHVGVSNHDLAQWQACEAALGGPVLSNQVRFSLVHREPERELVPWAQRNGRIVIAYSPLGQGLLGGRYQAAAPTNLRRYRSDFTAEARARRAPLVDALREVGGRHRATAAQVALAWLVAKPSVVAIPGASSVRQLEENAAAADLVLSGEEIAQLDRLSA